VLSSKPLAFLAKLPRPPSLNRLWGVFSFLNKQAEIS